MLMSMYSLMKKSKEYIEIEGSNDSIPSKLFKFVSLDDDAKSNNSKFDTLQNNQLWFSPIANFNDPYECKSMYADENMLRKIGGDAEMVQLYKNVLQKVGDYAVILSLSANNFDSLPMWAYYTNNYKGFCVEYEVCDPDYLFKVTYAENRLAATSVLVLFMRDLCDILEGKKEENDIFRTNATLLSNQLYRKHESWKHENEYRAIAMVCEARNGIPISTGEVGLKTKRIVAGISCKPEHLERLQTISDALSCGKVLQARTSKDKFTLFEEA